MAGRLKAYPWVKILTVILVPSVLLNIYLLFNKTSPPPNTQVIGVIDGDTLVTEEKAKIRLRYVDAPELNYCGGKEAKDYLKKLTVGKKIRIEKEIPDQYGRAMAFVYSGNKFINKEILASGWVRYHHDNSPKTEELKTAVKTAQDNKLGIYSLCQSKENITNPECNIKGNIDKNSNARKYYLPGCTQYEFTIVEKDLGEDWFCSENEAQSGGFIKAETCR